MGRVMPGGHDNRRHGRIARTGRRTFVVADDVQGFAAACIELSQNIRKLNRMAANGLDLVQQHYSLEAVREKRLETYETFLATPWGWIYVAVFRRLSAPAERRHSTAGISFSKAVVTSERVGKESTTMMFGLMLLRIARENSLLTAERWASV
jgi:hypothetical protein